MRNVFRSSEKQRKFTTGAYWVLLRTTQKPHGSHVSLTLPTPEYTHVSLGHPQHSPTCLTTWPSAHRR